MPVVAADRRLAEHLAVGPFGQHHRGRRFGAEGVVAEGRGALGALQPRQQRQHRAAGEPPFDGVAAMRVDGLDDRCRNRQAPVDFGEKRLEAAERRSVGVGLAEDAENAVRTERIDLRLAAGADQVVRSDAEAGRNCEAGDGRTGGH